MNKGLLFSLLTIQFPGRSALLALYTLTLFLAALLTFSVQPLVARMVLPYFGGSASVWNTCVLFFQFGLLTGYAYSHFGPRLLGVRGHKILHLVLMGIALIFLPLSIPIPSLSVSFPIALQLLGILLLQVGLPFFLVTTTAPLAQHWFSLSTHRKAHDPYFLYAASNLGSLLALALYPAFLEPNYTLPSQSWIWAGSYGLLILLIGMCALLSANRNVNPPLIYSSNDSRPEAQANGHSKSDNQPTNGSSPSGRSTEVSLFRRLHWVTLAFVPSSLMLSVTTYLSTDIAPMPLLWVTPLAIYLFTFILAFSKFPHLPVVRITPIAILIVTLLLLSESTEPLFLVMGIHLGGLFVIALMCHGELAELRPHTKNLTEFYVWIALGGMLGGMFNSLIAPLIFKNISEYPIALILACLLWPGRNPKNRNLPNSVKNFAYQDLLPGLGLAVLTLAIVVSIPNLQILMAYVLPDYSFDDPHNLRRAAFFGLPIFICYVMQDRPVRFALGVAGLFLALAFDSGIYGKVEFGERTFFGVHRVTIDSKGKFRRLYHGNTIHGQQFLDPKRQGEPLTYYHRKGPIGGIFLQLKKSKIQVNKVGLVGLGVGSLAAYAEPGQDWTFYEIDPVVRDIATNPEFFTFLQNSKAKTEIIIGDARLSLTKTPDKYDVMVIDAFNSDSLPIHLLTKEALALYLEHLQPDGIIAFHISNRYLNLEPVLAALANDANLLCYSRQDLRKSNTEEEEGKFPSHWIMMGKDCPPIRKVARRKLWFQIKKSDSKYLWTDNYSNVLNIYKWNELK